MASVADWQCRKKKKKCIWVCLWKRGRKAKDMNSAAALDFDVSSSPPAAYALNMAFNLTAAIAEIWLHCST